MRSYPIVSDGLVNISFGAITENPAIKAIEIVGAGSTNARYFAHSKTLNTNVVTEDTEKRESTDSNFDVMIYPNPFDDIINIQFNHKVDPDNLEILVINDLGVSMEVENIHFEDNLLIVNVATLNLSTSAYTLSIRDLEKDKHVYKRIIKDK